MQILGFTQAIENATEFYFFLSKNIVIISVEYSLQNVWGQFLLNETKFLYIYFAQPALAPIWFPFPYLCLKFHQGFRRFYAIRNLLPYLWASEGYSFRTIINRLNVTSFDRRAIAEVVEFVTVRENFLHKGRRQVIFAFVYFCCQPLKISFMDSDTSIFK